MPAVGLVPNVGVEVGAIRIGRAADSGMVDSSCGGSVAK